MKNIIADKPSILCKYADNVYGQFRKQRYGINCSIPGVFNHLSNYKKLSEWQAQLEDNIVNETDITFITDLPALNTNKPFVIGGLGQRNETTVRLQYDVNNTESVIIESDGCQTVMTINPTACVSPRQSMIFSQSTPALEWVIDITQLGFIPNIRTENLSGNDIDGIIDVSVPDQITITFSSAVAGKAYLS